MMDFLLSLLCTEIGLGITAGIGILGWILQENSTESYTLYGWRPLFFAMQWIGLILACGSLVGMVLGAGQA